jgi:hypothetical protein
MTEVSSEFGPMVVFLLTAGIILLVLVAVVLSALIFCKIFAKAGYHWALGLLLLLPVVSLVALLYLAFADWPVQRELRQLRQIAGPAA